MLWEGRALRDIHEVDVRRVLESGVEEHLQLEYKSALYEDNDRDRREFLQDVCMFANTTGGILLIGITELRDEREQPTGVPDRDAVLGLDIPNPEAVLGSYDARVMEAVEERLPLESAPIEVGGGKHVLALRVPNSTRKPHSVRHGGHIYFAARRERQRYSMNVREIKELVMRTASRLQDAKDSLRSSFLRIPRPSDLPYLITGIIPVFSEDFMLDVRRPGINRAVADFSRTELADHREPTYTFDGIERHGQPYEHTVELRRNGLLIVSTHVPLDQGMERVTGQHVVQPAFIDVTLRNFLMRARTVHDAGGIGGPFVLGMMLRTQAPLSGKCSVTLGVDDITEPIPPRDYVFPYMEADDLSDLDRIMRPLCDQAHQAFGRGRSPYFNAEGVWTGR